MNANVNTQDRVALTAVVRLLLEGAELISFKYDSGFTVHFQHAPGRTDASLPVQVSLVLRAAWWPAASREIPADLKIRNPEKLLVRPEQPYQAFKLMSFVGHTVEHVEIGSDSSLSLLLSSGLSQRVR